MATCKRFTRSGLMLAAIGLLGLGLRLIQLDFQPLWWDEGYSVWFAAHSLPQMLRLTAVDIHPPLYYWLLHGWAHLMGWQPASLRLFSVLLSLPAIFLAYALGRDVRDRTTGLLAALLLALNPFAIYYAQEIRMYGLGATLSLAAMWTGWRWFQGQSSRSWMWGIAYALSLVAGVYTLYLWILLPVAQLMWVLLTRRQRLRASWLFWMGAALLYLPWIIYAGPKLLHYVAYKVVMDNDEPLGFLAYVGQHLSAFVAGHLTGPMAAWWPAMLLLLLPPGLALMRSMYRPGTDAGSRAAISYLATILLTALLVGFIQQTRAPFIPEHFQRVLLYAAPALWLLLALGLRQIGQHRWQLAWLLMVMLFGVQAASLHTFYTQPRYAQRDYRPLVAQVQQDLRPGDAIFAIYPWQAGYFLAYLPPELAPVLVQEAGTPWNADGTPITPILLSPETDWTPAVQQTIDALRQYGAVWFPEHLSLGGIFENKVERYLAQNSFQVLNRWYGAETRLTAWDGPHDVAHRAELPALQWQNGVRLDGGWFTTTPYRLFFHLTWQGDPVQNAADGAYVVWLRGPDGRRWARRDLSQQWREQEAVALTLPAGLPPGDYELHINVLDAALRPLSVVGDAARLPTLTLAAEPDVMPRPRHPQRNHGDAVIFLGYDGGDAPVQPGDDLEMVLYWLPQGPIEPDQRLFLQLLDAGGALVAGMEAPPLSWYPTSRWRNAPLRTCQRLRIPAQLSPGRYELIAGLFDVVSGQRLQWSGGDALHLRFISVLPREHDFTHPQPAQPLDALWQGNHKLAGFSLDAGAQQDAAFHLTLFWQPAGPLDERYSVFIHLVDAQGKILAQDDAEPAAGAHPTTSWLAGETVLDAHSLARPQAAGSLSLRVGLYEPETGRRLPLVDASGQIIGDFLSIPLSSEVLP